jgi:hypothetical protein
MILQLFAKLKEAETIANASVKAAEDAWLIAKRAGHTAEQLAPLDPGRHQVALGALQTSLAHVQTILGPEAVAEATKAIQAEQAAAKAAADAKAAETAAQATVDNVKAPAN